MRINQESHHSIHGEINLFRLTNSSGASVELSNLGAGITAINVPDAQGNLDNIVIAYANPVDYFNDAPCAGKTPGRYANRIAKGKFVIDDKEYQLAINNSPNALHGGPMGFHNHLWNSEIKENEGKVIFNLTSEDGDEGYPGTLKVTVAYTWSDNNELTIEYEATCDKATVVNLTNHTYFNLSGKGTILDHTLWLNSKTYLPTDITFIPTGLFDEVAGTPMDFTQAKSLGKDIFADFTATNYGKGYNHCWVINEWAKGKLQKIAILADPNTKRIVEISTTQPSVQVYTGNWLSESPQSKTGDYFNDYDGVALECQGMPDAPNNPQFPTQELRPGELYNETIKFLFAVKQL